MGSSPDNAWVAQHCRMGHAVVSETGRYTKGTGVIKPPKISPARTRWIRAGMRCVPEGACLRGTPEPVFEGGQGGLGECLRRSQGDAAGVKPDASPVDRRTANVGTAHYRSFLSPLPAEMEEIGAMLTEEGVRGGAAVVVRAGESPCTWRRAAVISCQLQGVQCPEKR